MKPGPAYECKSLFPSKGKNTVVENNSKFPAKTYTFDVYKCEEIFDLLVKDGQILVPIDSLFLVLALCLVKLIQQQ